MYKAEYVDMQGFSDFSRVTLIILVISIAFIEVNHNSNSMNVATHTQKRVVTVHNTQPLLFCRFRGLVLISRTAASNRA